VPSRPLWLTLRAYFVHPKEVPPGFDFDISWAKKSLQKNMQLVLIELGELKTAKRRQKQMRGHHLGSKAPKK
jgi:hypothetical protein